MFWIKCFVPYILSSNMCSDVHVVVSLLRTSFFLLLLVQSFPTSGSVQGTAQQRDLNSVLKNKFITFARRGFEEHNNFRALHHVAPLKWSDKLAIQAQKLAYKMALKGTIQVPGIDVFGENRAKLSSVNFDCEEAGEEATKIWYNQGSNYSFADPRLNSNTDSFTQVIWQNTRALGMGCAQRKGTLSNEIFVVALYYPPGNSPRLLRQNVLSPSKNVNDAYSSIFRRGKTTKKHVIRKSR